MRSWATPSAWIRWAPSLTNILPAADLPLAMPPVRPSFSNGFSWYPKGRICQGSVSPAARVPETACLDCIYRHDSKLCRSKCCAVRNLDSDRCPRLVKADKVLSLGAGHLGLPESAPQPCGFYCVGHKHGYGQRAYAPGDGRDRPGYFGHLRMNVPYQG